MEHGQANWFPRLALPSNEISTAIAKLLAQDPNKALDHDSPTQVCLIPQTSTYDVFSFTPKDAPKNAMFLTPAFLRTAETTNCHSSLHPTFAAESPEIKFLGPEMRKPNTSLPIAFQTKKYHRLHGDTEAKPWLPHKGDSFSSQAWMITWTLISFNCLLSPSLGDDIFHPSYI